MPVQKLYKEGSTLPASLIYPRILLTGGTGQVGWELICSLKNLGEVWAPTRAEFDLSNPQSLRNTIKNYKPSLIVNSAAYTAVDKAESESELAYTINAQAPKVLAEEAKKLDVLLVHFSTDYVFDGKKCSPYTEEDEPNPINIYGKSKLDGELAIQECHNKYLILRTAWVYSKRSNNFFTVMTRLLEERETLNIVADQMGTPTSAHSLALASTQIILKAHSHLLSNSFRSEIINTVASGSTTWFDFANEIADRMSPHPSKCQLSPISTSEYPTAAKRPLNSRLNNQQLKSRYKIEMPDWKIALDECINSR